jgi:hypothetical protein
MKTFFVTLAAFSIALIVGCQESMLNEPADVLMKGKDNLVSTNTIKLKYALHDPLFGTTNLSGKVSYTFQIVNRVMNPTGLKEISIHITMDSELDDLFGMMHLEWRIQGRSDDVVHVSEEGILLIEKCYSITNRSDVVLLVQYLVTTNGIGISGVSLAPLEQ